MGEKIKKEGNTKGELTERKTEKVSTSAGIRVRAASH